ncbi:MAG: type restriction enzyme protein [Thermomicrobiales bacterium]|nr:type restriction enzyme protein [Thermomicrobiales bacterium]
MAHEQTQPPYGRPSVVPTGYDWPVLLAKDGDALEIQYRHTLESLGTQPGMLGVIFRKAQNKIQNPAKLRRLVADLIDKTTWTTLSADVKGGAGQYFTPRPLIQAIVDVVRPAPGETICDPACGTGGFLLAAHDYVAHHHQLDADQKRHLKLDALRGVELVDGVTRLCAMNLLLHGIGPTAELVGAHGGAPTPPVRTGDSLAKDPGDRFDLVLTNPPFGRKSSVLTVTDEGEQERETLVVVRDDFWASTSNKQLNFVQHVKTILSINGRAAVVVPNNVLFEGGAGETVRRKLLHECDVHTLLRLPTGIFYAQGVKANVLFFDRKPASPAPWTKTLWIYDLRTNMHFTLKTNAPTSTTSSPPTAPPTATTAPPPGPPTPPMACGAPTPTRTLSRATRSPSTSSGSKTTLSNLPPTSPTPTSSPPRSSKTSAPPSKNSTSSPPTSPPPQPTASPRCFPPPHPPDQFPDSSRLRAGLCW